DGVRHERVRQRPEYLWPACEPGDAGRCDDALYLERLAVREREPEAARPALDTRDCACVDGDLRLVAEPVRVREEVFERQRVRGYEASGVAPARDRQSAPRVRDA